MKKSIFIFFIFSGIYSLSAQEVDYNKVVNIFLGDLPLYKKISFKNKEKALKPNFRLINKLKKVGSQPKGKELLIKMIRLNDEIDNFSSLKKEESSRLDREISMLSSQIENLNSKHSKHERELKRLKSEMKYYESLASKARRNYNKYSSLGNARHYLNDAKKYDGKAKSYERRHNNYLRDSKVNQLAQKVNSLIAKKESAKRNRSLTYSDGKLDALKTKLKSLKNQVEDEFDKNIELFASDQNDLGNKYFYGRGVTKDYSEAIKWYRKSAYLGNVYAYYNLGRMYENGYGVTKDYEGAVEWYHKAADQDFKPAIDRLIALEVIEIVEVEEVEEPVIEVVEDEVDVEVTVIEENLIAPKNILKDRYLLFSSNRTSFKKGVTNQIDDIVTILKYYPQTKIELIGFTDNKEESAMLLSEKRAKAVKAYMVARGKINESRISVKFKGKQNPRNTNFTESGRAYNRRVEVYISN